MMAKDLLRIADLSPGDLTALVGLAADLKHQVHRSPCRPLAAELVALYFARPSNRIRVTFTDAATRLGASVVMLGPAELRQRHSATGSDVARFVGHYAAVVVAHTDEDDLHRLAGRATIPVVNGLGPRHDPCQGVADLLTLQEQFGCLDSLAGLRVAYLGPTTPALHSLIEACALAAIDLRIATPVGQGPDAQTVAGACTVAARSGGRVVVADPLDAVDGADAVYLTPPRHGELAPGGRIAFSDEDSVRRADQAIARAGVLLAPSNHLDNGSMSPLARHPRGRVHDQVENRLPAAAAMLATAVSSPR
jgi:ornithine carbamoyltransferase